MIRGRRSLPRRSSSDTSELGSPHKHSSRHMRDFASPSEAPTPPSAGPNNSGLRASSSRYLGGGGDVFDKFADRLRQTAFFSTAIDIARQTLPEPALIWL